MSPKHSHTQEGTTAILWSQSLSQWQYWYFYTSCRGGQEQGRTCGNLLKTAEENLRAPNKGDDLISVYRVQSHIFITSQLRLRPDIQIKHFIDSWKHIIFLYLKESDKFLSFFFAPLIMWFYEIYQEIIMFTVNIYIIDSSSTHKSRRGNHRLNCF